MKVKGKEEFAAQIARLPKMMREEIARALRVSAEETVDVMRRFAPVKSGALRASIDYNFGAPTKGVLSSASRSAKGDAELSVVMTAGDERAYYARMQEFGTQKMAANPFFYPGYRFGKKRAKSRLARAIRTGARKALK